MATFFDTPIEFLKGVGPQRAAQLNRELSIFTYGDLIQHYPFRYEDRTRFYSIRDITDEMQYVQVKGTITRVELQGEGRRKRLTALFKDDSGQLDLVWFQGINWIAERLKPNVRYTVFGKPTRYGTRWSMVHPEFEVLVDEGNSTGSFFPVYPLTEKLRTRRLDSKFLSRLMQELLTQARGHIKETLPASLCARKGLMPKHQAMQSVHFPADHESLAFALRRLKFEELFYTQIRLIRLKLIRKEKFRGQPFTSTALLTNFYNSILPYPLTGAQKRVIRKIYADLKSGMQMNRLLQGDVGSGKTIVAFICMLIAVGSEAQCVLMAPTEILAHQHFQNLKVFASAMDIPIAILTGSTARKVRKEIHEKLRSGELKILVGTHALLEDEVRFHQLGLAIVDEQHRFGVAQRSRLWSKNDAVYPHVLVMTATPIPRTLAMTLYGDLDISVIDELPKGRKPVKTVHRYDSHRLQVNQFIRDQIREGRQVYMVYPLIEESEKLDLKHLMDGYESVSRAFPDEGISIVHGKMKAEAKDYEMNRFAKGETTIMVATTVIEVGVDIPNASVMVIENAERFGLLQLHQLRGRVGRGADQSYCILMTGQKLTTESRKRIETMVRTTDGFEIAEADLALRGPGDLMGTQQSGIPDLHIADLAKDGELLKEAREAAVDLLTADPDLLASENQVIARQIRAQRKSSVNWSRIS
ncbi:MAG TPA: ATP-dependent DNA helicase RecG [Cyclobacteriaceae bacterium]|nr:ATP-dependent DNA helicase RecG [Cyclobacteriaceae bacterium]